MSRSSSGFSGRRRRSKSRSRILRFSDIMPHPVQLAIQQMALPFPVEQLAQVLLFDSLFFVCLFLPPPPDPGAVHVLVSSAFYWMPWLFCMSFQVLRSFGLRIGLAHCWNVTKIFFVTF